MVRARDAYSTIWGLTEQPTTILSAITTTTFGQRVKFNRDGWLVGLRFGRHSNVSDGGAVGGLWPSAAPRFPLRVCMWLPRVASGGATIVWTNAYFHKFFPVVVGTVYELVVDPLLNAMSYTDAYLLAGDVTIGDFTYPQHTATFPNGATGANVGLFANTAANGRRYTIDALFLPR